MIESILFFSKFFPLKISKKMNWSTISKMQTYLEKNKWRADKKSLCKIGGFWYTFGASAVWVNLWPSLILGARSEDRFNARMGRISSKIDPYWTRGCNITPTAPRPPLSHRENIVLPTKYVCISHTSLLH